MQLTQEQIQALAVVVGFYYQDEAADFEGRRNPENHILDQFVVLKEALSDAGVEPDGSQVEQSILFRC